MITRILTQYPALITTFTVGVLLLLGVMVGYLWAQRNDLLTTRVRKSHARTTRERLRAIYNLTVNLINTLNYERVLDIALDMSSTAFSEDSTFSRSEATRSVSHCVARRVASNFASSCETM